MEQRKVDYILEMIHTLDIVIREYLKFTRQSTIRN